jgi:cytosine/adenosine deaminase-related metal-dependent hydrolase
VSGTLLLTDVWPFGGPSRDLPVVDGRIARVGERLEAPEGAAVVAGRGHLAVPRPGPAVPAGTARPSPRHRGGR